MQVTLGAMRWLKAILIVLVTVLVVKLLYNSYGGDALNAPQSKQLNNQLQRLNTIDLEGSNIPKALASPIAETKTASTTSDPRNQLLIPRPLPAGVCGAYRELRDVNFLHPTIKENICEGAVAFQTVNSSYPVCPLKQKLPQLLTDAVKAGSIQTFIKIPLTQRTVPSFVYSSPDLISNSIRGAHIFEERNVRIMQRITQKLAAQSPVTFLDIGSNIGVFTLSVLDLGVPVIALDANIRNLMRIKLSSEAANKPHKLHLLWNFISRQVSFMYLNFPQDCNMGGATKFGRAVADTIPTMSTTADAIVPLIDTKVVVMKVDIEGGEGEFFKSAQKMFDKFTVPVVHMEWLKHHMNDEERQFMIRFFTERHYSSRTMKDLNQPIDMRNKDYSGDDLIWIHQDFLKGGAVEL